MIGNGNVAIDVARMLVLDPDELAATDTADHAIGGARRAPRSSEVIVLGRRGPAQAAFTNPELRELGELQRADVDRRPGRARARRASARWLEDDGDATAQPQRRDPARLRRSASRTGKSHRIELRFLRSPVEILGEGEDGPVTGVRVVRNRHRASDGGCAPSPTGEEEVIECGLVLRSIGYRGAPAGRRPVRRAPRPDPQRGRPRARRRGRAARRRVRRRLDQARARRGVIGTNKKDAADTVARIARGREAGTLNAPAEPDADAIAAVAAPSACPDCVTWEGWQAIDAHERGWASRRAARASSSCGWPT